MGKAGIGTRHTSPAMSCMAWPVSTAW